MSDATKVIEARVHSKTCAASGIRLFELRALKGKLPTYEAGAHIDLCLPNSLVRSYSLVNAPEQNDRYVIAVNRDASSRGGSGYMHDVLRVGDTILVRPPRNNFPLNEDARHSILIAGGIGITPLWCMIQRLSALGASWTLYYAARSRRQAAFLEEITTLTGQTGMKATFHFDEELGGKVFDLSPVVHGAPAWVHLYCCGPRPMLSAFEAACAKRPADTVHLEYFSAPSMAEPAGGFSVTLAKSQITLLVPKGKTILDALIGVGIDVPFSCNEGVCGSCETRVISGVPDHKDVVLTEVERQAGNTMMICCSGSKSEHLVLDL